jgi:ribonuclease-3
MPETIAELFGLPPDAPHLVQALTHPSYANEQRSAADNQRLEFLGDAVLGFVTSDLLYQRFPGANEGTLTRMRADLVNADALAAWARSIDLSAALLLGRGAEAGGLRDSKNVLADAVEALIAAAYLDGGLETARSACRTVVGGALERLRDDGARDPKSELQERVQALGGEPPTYRVVDSGGPAHDRWFEVAVCVGGEAVAQGRGSSKRSAERAAAHAALDSGGWKRAPGLSREDEAPDAPGEKDE